ncbi:hypothetical protein GLOTRDRAFT_118519 [Gloeophyllum trabeum ATCC 11539]|uniref:RING-type domain-containing protein n=1 Tax=Gloeophyllum trabeum (strain ATCC 11539 / FP-39264 / Madison 617) TaxID=670483 RepID=S7RYS7_GLOTA|nr:uncharacterized protein GLOTRDRAFT_118519 [Gloeophyllum trabeum ATCC 11539]EPQ60105.1 hypothetical protein GLOTRDRAFT_118519 [Gloeophyllum trabeum ATCC 11539]
MASREPMWYCHECHAEMRPLMQPDPICASCHGSFVERIENPQDDPRAFTAPGLPGGGDVPEFDQFLIGLHDLLAHPRPRSPAPRPSSPDTSASRAGGGVRIEFSSRRPGGVSTFIIGGPNTLGRSGSSDSLNGGPPMFMRRNSANGGTMGDDPDNGIAGNLMMQYLISMLSQRPGQPGGRDPLGGLGGLFGPMFGGAEGGRWGDYVFSQEALDQIMTQLMENSNAHRPVPAPEDVVAKLPREVLQEGSPLLEKDCAVCKEQFKLGTEDPDEQIVVTLPCKHPFHEPCILPWLKSSGTCPVCRFALVPQNNENSSGSPPAGGSRGPGSRPGSPSNNRPRSPGSGGSQGGGGGGGGLLSSLLSHLNPLQHSNNGGGGSSGPSRSRSDPEGNSGSHLPGSWSEPVD